MEQSLYPPTITDNETSTPNAGDSNGASAIEDLPRFQPTSAPNFLWGEKDGETFSHSLNQCYSEIVHWRHNLFKVPSGRAGKMFTCEMTRLFRAYADTSALESIALRAAMVMPALLLQKPHSKSKAKDHTILLERRLQQWTSGDLADLMNEGRTIQHQATRAHRNQNKDSKQNARIFAKLMMEGKVRAALRLIANDDSNGPLCLDSQIEPNNPSNPETVREVLKKKHPPNNQESNQPSQHQARLPPSPIPFFSTE